MASCDLFIKTTESVSHTSVAVKSAFDCGFISIVFLMVSVQPLDEVKAKVKVFVPIVEKSLDGFSTLEEASLLKFQ